MREVFEISVTPPVDPGRCFYVITTADIGKKRIRTTAEPVPIPVGDIMGQVLPDDVGKRLYRVPVNDGSGWIWQTESVSQRNRRLMREALITNVYLPEREDEEDREAQA